MIVKLRSGEFRKVADKEGEELIKKGGAVQWPITKKLVEPPVDKKIKSPPESK